jgi:hypothetical protein
VKLGLDMSGATLCSSRATPTDNDGNAGDALDLTLLRAKYVRLCRHKRCVDGIVHELTMRPAFSALGRVNLEHAAIDTDLDLEGSFFDRPLTAAFSRVGGLVCLVDVAIGSEMARHVLDVAALRRAYVERRLKPDLSLNGAEVGGALMVKDLSLKPPAAPIAPGRLHQFIVDLRSAHVGVLDDGGGTGWGTDLRLWLEGFRYNRLPDTAVVPELRRAGRLHLCRIWDPSWIRDATPLETSKSGALWKHRALWLRKQYFNGVKPSADNGFSPDAYEQVVLGMNVTGSYEDARRISSIQLTRNSDHDQRNLKPFWVAFRVLFDYGFSVRRAVITFSVCLAIGTAAAWIADYGFLGMGRVLVVNMSPPESRLVWDSNSAMVQAISSHPGETIPQDVPCGRRIYPLLYALDVFVPVLDLRQLEVCSIEPERRRWRLAQGAYAALGWIMTPILILTSSGLLRRHLEK